MSAKGVTVLGVSPDSVKSHQKFTEKHQLNFPLVADTDHTIAEAYGTWAEKSMYGRKYMGMERSTFVIDSNGVIRRAFRKVNIPGHVEEVASAVEAL